VRKGQSKAVTRRGQKVIETVLSVEEVPIMEAIWEDGDDGVQVQVGERQAGVAIHCRYQMVWPDGSVTYGSASRERLAARWGK